MTREQAEELVWDLIYAKQEAEIWPNKPTYQEDYARLIEKVVVALSSCDEARRLEQEDEFMRDLKESERTD